MVTEPPVKTVTEAGNGATATRAATEAAATMAHEFVDRVAKVASESEERIRKTANNAEAVLQQSLSGARTKLSSTGDSVTDFVQQHPFAALGIAFGTGVLLSYLTRGNRAARHDDTA